MRVPYILFYQKIIIMLYYFIIISAISNQKWLGTPNDTVAKKAAKAAKAAKAEAEVAASLVVGGNH
jgi:hypothetical protein